MPTYVCYKHHLHCLGAHYLHKASCEISASSLKEIFWVKVEEVQNPHRLCIIILINPSSYSPLGKSYWSSNITIDKSTSCPNFKSFRLLHHYWHTVKTHKKCRKIGVWPLLYSRSRFFPGYALFVRC